MYEKLITHHANVDLWFNWNTLVIPIPKCISQLRWWHDGEDFQRFIKITWGRNHVNKTVEVKGIE